MVTMTITPVALPDHGSIDTLTHFLLSNFMTCVLELENKYVSQSYTLRTYELFRTALAMRNAITWQTRPSCVSISTDLEV
jgi:hypothetical protein